MTKHLKGVLYDGDLSSASCKSIDITSGNSAKKDIVKENKKSEIENEENAIEEEESLSAYVSPTTPEDSEESHHSYQEVILETEAEIREKKYKRLMHLLKNSQMYAVILKNKLEEDEAKAKKNVKKTKSGLNEVLNEKDIKATTVKIKEENSDKTTLEEDFFKETRTTSLGFSVSIKQPLLLEGAVMRDYQLKGLEWMINLFHNGVNGILADEMGLGKTIQVISFICHLIEQNIKGPFLIVAPLSTLTNWMEEFKKFAPKVPVLMYHGSGSERKQLQQKILQTAKIGKKKVHNVIITSYQVPIYDKTFMARIHWYYLIIDEGHCIKNHKTQLSRTLRQFNAIGRLLLTGTPLQNNLSELWSLLNFLLPEVFSSLDVFESWFDIKSLEEDGAKFIQEKFNLDIVSVLQEILMPFLLRREKKDVNLNLPAKKEILIYCPMTQTQKKLYEATLNRSIERLLKRADDYVVNLNEPLPKRRCFLFSPYGNKNGKQLPPVKAESPKKEEERYYNHIQMANPQMQLRQIVNHPYLVQHPLEEGSENQRIDESMIQESGKLLVFDAMLKKLKAKGHRVLALSYFKVVLDILEEHAILRGYKYCRFDGSSDITARHEEISKFASDPEIFIFYATIRAGGLGINLTSADTVILFDSDWNPQINIQAQNRCHRIGQTKPVVVYRLCAIGTIDERIIERGNAKRRLEKMILQKGKYSLTPKSSPNLNLMDLQELKKLLESTDHDVVINSNRFVFTDEELDTVLDRADMTSINSTKFDKGFKLLNYEN